jgi:hypothetical protein
MVDERCCCCAEDDFIVDDDGPTNAFVPVTSRNADKHTSLNRNIIIVFKKGFQPKKNVKNKYKK